MTKKVRILYCHCAYAQVVPKAVKEQVFQTLSASGVEFEAVADLCELSARRDPRLKVLADGQDEIRIAACYPRAVKWLFAAGGAALAEDSTHVANMRTQNADEVVHDLLRDLPEAEKPAPAAPAEPPAANFPEKTGPWKPWFPVIDFGRCTNCMQCLSFCLFDVYGVSKEGKIAVQNPVNCKTDCPACSRVCPEVAILFPKYRFGPINGDEIKDDDLKRESMKIDISSLLGGDIYSMLRDRSAKAKSRFSKERDEERAIKERQLCLTKLQEQMDIPPEVLAALPSTDQIRAKAAEAKVRAEEALKLADQNRQTPARDA